jgi:RNA polymerase sigma-70 factor (ECF subfamily)
MQDHDTALVVREALAALPAEQRAALVLVDVQGYGVAEAAEILGVAEGTVKSRCSRGRARMAVALGHLRRGDEGHARAGNHHATGAVTSGSAATKPAIAPSEGRERR